MKELRQKLRAITIGAPPLRIVAIGGGTGLSTLLHGLKKYVCGEPEPGLAAAPIEITAVVTVTDDGGSSGRLRRELDILPPGDIRNCLVALSEDEALLSKLFQYRFASGRGLKGHSFGNLFLTALTSITGGDFAHAVKLSSEILASCGRVFPSTAENVVLEALLHDGRRVCGESLISKSTSPIQSVSIRPRECKPLPETLEAIAQADVICMGPGSLYTSVIPNLLVAGIPEAIRRAPALKVYFVNLMWQPGETMQFSASDHVEALHRHAQGWLVDYAIVNTEPIAAPQRSRYEAESAQPVEIDEDRLRQLGVRTIAENLLSPGEKVRHHSEVAARIVLELAGESRRRRLIGVAAGG